MQDVSLLTPGLACLVPLHRYGEWSALWQDVQHRVVTTGPPMSWLSALVYFVRHRPRLGARKAQELRSVCPPGCLAVALTDNTWTFDTHESADRTRTVMVLIAVDTSAAPGVDARSATLR